MINTGKNTPIIDLNDEKRITSQTKNDEIDLHPMHGGGRGWGLGEVTGWGDGRRRRKKEKKKFLQTNGDVHRK